MKKILSLALAVLMLVSALPMAYAAENQDYELGTAVVYTAENSTDYAITVPASLAPGASSTVTLAGTWPSNQTVKVTADSSVTLTNSINAADQKTLDVGFAGMEYAGDNTQARTYTETVSVAAMPSDALFGTWDGKFNYNVEFIESPKAQLSGSPLRISDVSDISHTPTINLSSNTITDFSDVTVTSLGKNLINISNITTTLKATDLVVDTENNQFEFKREETNSESYVSVTTYLPVGTYTLSYMPVEAANAVRVYDIENNKAVHINGYVLLPMVETFTIEESKIYRIDLFADYAAADGASAIFKNLQLELGHTMTEYEPYKSAQTVKANADGSVSGITSVAPTMTIYTDSDATITCEYQKKT